MEASLSFGRTLTLKLWLLGIQLEDSSVECNDSFLPPQTEIRAITIPNGHRVLCAQAWKPGSQHAGEKRGVAGLLLGRTERAARAVELQLCAQAR